MLSQLRKLAKREGYSVEAEKEFAALEAKLSHNEDFDFQRWKKEIKRLVEMNSLVAIITTAVQQSIASATTKLCAKPCRCCKTTSVTASF